MPLKLETLTADELRALAPDTTAFCFPVAALEDHGPHLAIGLPLAEAEQLAFLLAERIESEFPGHRAILMPTAPLGVSTMTTQCALPVRGHVLRDYLVDQASALARLGFRKFVAVTSQLAPRQLTAIEEADAVLQRKFRRILRLPLPGRESRPAIASVSAAWLEPKTIQLSPLWPDPTEHGGQRDTSVALCLDEEALTRPLWSGLPDSARPEEGDRLGRLRLRLQGRLRAYWGKPSAASREAGVRLLQERVDAVIVKLKAAWSGSPVEHVFRSGYGWFPPNRSFFGVWVLSALLTLILMVWVYLTLQWMMGDAASFGG